MILPGMRAAGLMGGGARHWRGTAPEAETGLAKSENNTFTAISVSSISGIMRVASLTERGQNWPSKELRESG